MQNSLKYWWLVLIKGIILIILSFFIFGHPVEALIGLAFYIGISLLFAGILLIIMALSIRKVDEQWGWRLAEGIIDVLFGFILLSNPALTAAVFPFVIGFWLIFYGVMIGIGSFTNKKMGDSNWWVNLIAGIFNIVLGYIIMSNLLIGAFAITVWIGIGFLIFGVVNVFLSISMKKMMG